MTEITQTNEYVWYKAALAGQNPPIHEDVIQSGRFRTKTKAGALIGVAIWRDWANVGMLMANWGTERWTCDPSIVPWYTKDENGKDKPATAYAKLLDRWKYLPKGVVTQMLYRAYWDSKCTKWPDESDAGREVRKEAPLAFQHPATTFDGLKERLEKYKPQAEALITQGEAPDGITADIAADLKNVFAGLKSTADEQRLAATHDLRKQVEAVNATWNTTLVKPAEDITKKLASIVIAPYQTKEGKRLQAEQDAKLAAARAQNVPVTEEMKQPVRVSSGTVGRKVTPRKITRANITDPRSFLAFLAGNDKIHPGILLAMQQIADAGASTDPAKCAVYPGVTYETTETAV